MNIVVLDGFAMNPGDLSWDGLKEFGTCTIYDRTPAEEVIARAKSAELILTNKTVLDREALQKLPKLRYIGVLATGYNIVDVEAARELGIVVCNVPAYSTEAVAQAVFAHILNLTHHVGYHAEGVSEGAWCKSKDFCYWNYPLIELSGLTMGIIGFGRIGKAVAKRALAFDMKVCVHTPHPPEEELAGIRFTDLDTLIGESDIVSLHCPLTSQSNNLMNKERFVHMKKTAFLINTSRGPLVNEQDLAAALDNNTIAGAGLDVLSQEPPLEENPLLKAKNCYITPHFAWATGRARKRLLQITIENIKAFLDSVPQNVVCR